MPTKYAPTTAHASLCIGMIFVLVFSGLFIIHASLHGIILLCIVWAILNAFWISADVERLKKCIQSTVQDASFLFLIFILIGAVIAAFTISGAIPTLVYYGLTLISPHYFLPIGLILCALMSLAIGTSWGTIGTIGVALMGVANILQIPAPITAGMIISGAYFGDKLSLISDTTILSAHSAKTDLYQHIRGMTYSVIPAFFISCGLFWYIGTLFYAPNAELLQSLQLTKQILLMHYHVGIVPMIPIIVLFLLTVQKKPAQLAMLVAVILALVIALWIQPISLSQALNSLLYGPKTIITNSPTLNAAFHHGGIQSMLWSLSLSILILILGGILSGYHFLIVLFDSLIQKIQKAFTLVFATISTAVLCNMLMGEAYLSIILTSQLFEKAYQRVGLERCVLSNAIEKGSTFSTPLIPWTTSGAFICSTLGISPSEYLGWSLFNWLAPIVFLLIVRVDFLGISLFKKTPLSLSQRGAHEF